MKRLILAVILCLAGVANAGFIPGQVLTAAQLNTALGAVTGLATTTNPVVVSGASAPSAGQVLTATSPTAAAWSTAGLSIPAYLGTACNNTLYPASLLCVSNAPTTDVENHNIGIVGGGLATYAASGTPLTGWGIGVYGKGWTNGYTRSSGVTGEGMVTATGDVGSAIGIRGYSLQTHAGGSNIGVLGDASGGATNYDFYSVNGKATSATGLWTNTGDFAVTGVVKVPGGSFTVSSLQFGGSVDSGLYSLGAFDLRTRSSFTAANISLTGAISSAGVAKLSNGYTVATLPAGAVGQRAYVTDALAPTFMGTLTGGGAVVTPVFHNGTAWVVN